MTQQDSDITQGLNPNPATEDQAQTAKKNIALPTKRGMGILFTYLPELIRITLAVAISVAATIYIVTTYFYRPIVVLDLTSLVNIAREKATLIKDDETRVNYIAKYFDSISKDIKSRKELVIVKEAVVNAEQFKEITEEYKADKYMKTKE